MCTQNPFPTKGVSSLFRSDHVFFVSLSFCLFDNVLPEYKISNNIKLSNKIWPNYGKNLVSYGICYAFNLPLTFQRQSLRGVHHIGSNIVIEYCIESRHNIMDAQKAAQHI